MVAARSYITETKFVASNPAATRPAVRPPMRETPSPSSRTASAPMISDTSLACHRPTPNARKLAYSRPVSTGVTYIGFQRSPSTCHWPVRARFRALWTQAPSSCQTTPTDENHGGSASGNTIRSVMASSMIAASTIANRHADSPVSREVMASPVASR